MGHRQENPPAPGTSLQTVRRIPSSGRSIRADASSRLASNPVNTVWLVVLAACLTEGVYAAVLRNWLVLGLMIALAINVTFQLLMFRKRQ
jgi:hypothetical protein